MKIRGLISEDYINYKLPSMVIEFPFCDFKCDKECGYPICQNSDMIHAPIADISMERLVKFYMENDITQAIVFQGLEPFDSLTDVFQLIKIFRTYTKDPIIIYTGYTEKECDEIIQKFKQLFKNIIIKFGRFIPNSPHHYDNLLGVTLMSPNQYAKKIC